MKNILKSILFILPGLAVAQSSDKIETSAGTVTINPVVHGTLVLEWNDQTIYVDPYGGGEKFANFDDADIILITDIHGDHHNQETLDALNTESSTFVVPQAVADKLPDSYEVKVIGNGESMELNGLSIAAIPMYNLPEDADSRHTKGRGNGYILTIGDKKIYMSGDTEDIPEMRSLTDIDVAFVCMNLPYTMDINQAASAVSEFKPGIVYPYHYRGQGGLADTEKFKSLVNESAPEVEVRIRNWYSE